MALIVVRSRIRNSGRSRTAMVRRRTSLSPVLTGAASVGLEAGLGFSRISGSSVIQIWSTTRRLLFPGAVAVATKVVVAPDVSFRLVPSWGETLKEGRYLLRTNLHGRDPAELWQFYIQLAEIAAVFKNLKDDLGLRPIHHQLEHRIEAHIFVAFIAYCLHVTLSAWLKSVAGGLTPRAVLDKLGAIQMLDVHFPTTDGRTLILSRYTAQLRPKTAHKATQAHLAPAAATTHYCSWPTRRRPPSNVVETFCPSAPFMGLSPLLTPPVGKVGCHWPNRPTCAANRQCSCSSLGSARNRGRGGQSAHVDPDQELVSTERLDKVVVILSRRGKRGVSLDSERVRHP
jgi:hypothetical protein